MENVFSYLKDNLEKKYFAECDPTKKYLAAN